MAAAIAGAMVLTGCAAEEGPSEASSDEIVIGNIGTYSGLVTVVAPTRKVLEAWVQEVNDNGGLSGKRVRLIVKDDTGNATRALAAARELVEQEKVDAIVGQMSLFDQAWASYISSTDVPVIGGLPFQATFATNASFFPSGGNQIARAYTELDVAKEYGSNFGQLYCAEAPGCKIDSDLFRQFATKVDVNFPVSQTISASQPNFTAQCQNLIDADVDTYQVGHTSDVALRVMDACFAQGLRARQITTGGIATDEWLTHKSAEGTIDVGSNFPFFDTSTPGTKAYNDLRKEYGLTGKELSGASGTYVYAGAELFEAAVKGVGEAEVTRASLKKALYAMKGETLDGVAPPLTFNPDGPTLVNCFVVSTLKNGEWSAPDGLKYRCAPDDLVTKASSILTEK